MAVNIRIDEITKKMQELYPKIDECRNSKRRLLDGLGTNPSTIKEFKNVCEVFGEHLTSRTNCAILDV